MWRRWIYDDYYRSYLMPLEKYGLKIHHEDVEEAWNRIANKGYVHKTAQFFATGWFANFWRIDPMTEEDFEWFEFKYPGWYNEYGKWWEHYASYPSQTVISRSPLKILAMCIHIAAGRVWFHV